MITDQIITECQELRDQKQTQVKNMVNIYEEIDKKVENLYKEKNELK